jgi:hypothetical protein
MHRQDEEEKEQHMQQRGDRRGDGLGPGRTALFLGPKGACSGTQKRVRQG